MSKVVNAIKKYGILGLIIKVLNKISYRIFRFFNRLSLKYDNREKQKQRELLQKEYEFLHKKMIDQKYKYVFIFYPYTEWNLPIFQRPQHIALELAEREDILYLFCSTNYNYDFVDGLYKEINPNLYIVTDYEYLLTVPITNRVMHFYSTDVISEYEELENAYKRGDKVVYEYIDEIHEEITQSLPWNYLEKHRMALENEHFYVVTTADKLYNDVKRYRSRNFILATNGVTIEDFEKNENDEMPAEIKELKQKYDKLICYYGALAVWFDYELIKKISKKFPNYAIVLIGIEYDDAFKKSQISELENVHYLGKKDYYELHKYSEHMDLLTIPFLINEITESTSPVKLFEYMATEIPILTTNMKECQKYKSVITAKDHDDFLQKINSTMDLINDPKYINLERKEARENTWAKKSEEILKLIDKSSKKGK